MCGGAFMEMCGYMWGQTKRKDLEATLQGLFIWWSIVHSTRTFMQVFHYRVPCVSSQETEEHQRVSTPAHGLF